MSIVAIILNQTVFTSLYNDTETKSLINDVIISFFTGAFLSETICLLEYFNEKQKVLSEIYNLLVKQKRQFEKIVFFDENLYNKIYSILTNKDKTLSEDSFMEKLIEKYSLEYADNLSIEEKHSKALNEIEKDKQRLISNYNRCLDSCRNIEYYTDELIILSCDADLIFKNRKLRKTLSSVWNCVYNTKNKLNKYFQFHDEIHNENSYYLYAYFKNTVKLNNYFF